MIVTPSTLLYTGSGYVSKAKGISSSLENVDVELLIGISVSQEETTLPLACCREPGKWPGRSVHRING